MKFSTSTIESSHAAIPSFIAASLSADLISGDVTRLSIAAMSSADSPKGKGSKSPIKE